MRSQSAEGTVLAAVHCMSCLLGLSPDNIIVELVYTEAEPKHGSKVTWEYFHCIVPNCFKNLFSCSGFSHHQSSAIQP